MATEGGKLKQNEPQTGPPNQPEIDKAHPPQQQPDVAQPPLNEEKPFVAQPVQLSLIEYTNMTAAADAVAQAHMAVAAAAAAFESPPPDQLSAYATHSEQYSSSSHNFDYTHERDFALEETVAEMEQPLLSDSQVLEEEEPLVMDQSAMYQALEQGLNLQHCEGRGSDNSQSAPPSLFSGEFSDSSVQFQSEIFELGQGFIDPDSITEPEPEMASFPGLAETPAKLFESKELLASGIPALSDIENITPGSFAGIQQAPAALSETVPAAGFLGVSGQGQVQVAFPEVSLSALMKLLPGEQLSFNQMPAEELPEMLEEQLLPMEKLPQPAEPLVEAADPIATLPEGPMSSSVAIPPLAGAPIEDKEADASDEKKELKVEEAGKVEETKDALSLSPPALIPQEVIEKAENTEMQKESEMEVEEVDMGAADALSLPSEMDVGEVDKGAADALPLPSEMEVEEVDMGAADALPLPSPGPIPPPAQLHAVHIYSQGGEGEPQTCYIADLPKITAERDGSPAPAALPAPPGSDMIAQLLGPDGGESSTAEVAPSVTQQSRSAVDTVGKKRSDSDSQVIENEKMVDASSSGAKDTGSSDGNRSGTSSPALKKPKITEGAAKTTRSAPKGKRVASRNLKKQKGTREATSADAQAVQRPKKGKRVLKAEKPTTNMVLRSFKSI